MRQNQKDESMYKPRLHISDVDQSCSAELETWCIQKGVHLRSCWTYD